MVSAAPQKQEKAKAIGTTEERGGVSEGNAGKEEEEEEGEEEVEGEKERESGRRLVYLFSSGACSLRIFPQWSSATCVHTSVCVRVR